MYTQATAPPASYINENDELPPYEAVAGISETHSLYGIINSSSIEYDHYSKGERTESSTSTRSRQLSITPIQTQPFTRSRCSSAATIMTNNSKRHMSPANSLLSSSTRLYPSVSLQSELSPVTAFIKEEWEPALDITQRKIGALSALVNRARSMSVERCWRCARIEVKDGLILCNEAKQSGSIWGGVDGENKDNSALMATFRLRHATIEPPRHVSGRDHCIALHLMNGHTAILSLGDSETAMIWKEGLTTEIACASADPKCGFKNRSLVSQAPIAKSIR